MIDYKLLGAAVSFYEKLGYMYVETPWLVSSAAILHSAPPGIDYPRVSCLTKRQYLVASSEQGACQIDLDSGGFPEKAIFVSPCFRNEPVLDDKKHFYFMKAELFSLGDAQERVIADACQLFSSLSSFPVSRVNTDIGVDLEINGIEIGSYGVRSLPSGKKYTYGTGLALPRFTFASKAHK
jgi:hypothetical protein